MIVPWKLIGKGKATCMPNSHYLVTILKIMAVQMALPNKHVVFLQKAYISEGLTLWI